MTITIRQESPADYKAVSQVIQAAFKPMAISDQTEHLIMHRLRGSEAFIPELSLVAVVEDEIVGHILLTEIQIKSDDQTSPSLALAPVSVLPTCQRQGVGSRLILEAHRIAKKLGYTSIVLLGHPSYYPRFGYRQASEFGITLPFETQGEHCMAIELTEDALKDVEGMVIYPPEFFE